MNTRGCERLLFQLHPQTFLFVVFVGYQGKDDKIVSSSGLLPSEMKVHAPQETKQLFFFRRVPGPVRQSILDI